MLKPKPPSVKRKPARRAMSLPNQTVPKIRIQPMIPKTATLIPRMCE